MAVRDFEQRFVYRTRNLSRLRMPGHCPFLSAHGCSVHPAKPTQCRAFPFWPELIEDRKEWDKAAQWCPGLGKGPHAPAEHVRDCARQMRQSYPHTYGK